MIPDYCPDCANTRRLRDPETDTYRPCPNCSATHECVFVEEQEPSGRLILPPCLVCGLTAMDAIQQIRDDVLAIHKPTQVWTDSTIADDGERQEALYDDAGGLVYAPDVRTVCEGCDIRDDIPWPCPTARAAGVTE